MKKEITLYYDNDWKFYATIDDLQDAFIDRQEEDIESYDEPIYKDINDWVQSMVYDGWFEEITATLSDGMTVYPHYYLEENKTVLTIMQLYMEWENNYDCRNFETFADFLNIPQEDRNAIMFYGFE